MRILNVTRLAPLLLLAACAPAATTVESRPAAVYADPQSIDDVYAQSVANAAVYSPENVLPLFPAVPDGDGNVRVVTLTSQDYASSDSILSEIWVSIPPEVQDSCRTWNEEERDMRLRQVLGLQPTSAIRHFVVMTVPAADLFRPTVDPSITTRWPCREDQVRSGSCGLNFPAGSDSAHVWWMANQMLSSWQVPNGYPGTPVPQDTTQGQLGYPWTRLGYTYNWHPGSPRYGASEYVVRVGGRIRVDATIPIADYCRRP